MFLLINNWVEHYRSQLSMVRITFFLEHVTCRLEAHLSGFLTWILEGVNPSLVALKPPTRTYHKVFYVCIFSAKSAICKIEWNTARYIGKASHDFPVGMTHYLFSNQRRPWEWSLLRGRSSNLSSGNVYDRLVLGDDHITKKMVCSTPHPKHLFDRKGDYVYIYIINTIYI